MLSTLRSTLLSVSFVLIAPVNSLIAQSNLQITYGNSGVQTLSYNGVKLEDLGQRPSDAFHIWHMKMTDLNGNVATCAQCGWGENNNGRSWDPATHTWTYLFSWGSITVQFQQLGDTLNMNVTEINRAGSGLVLDGASIYPLVLNFPQLPAGFVSAAYPQLAYETIGPGVTPADFGSGEVVAVNPDSAKPLYSGFQPTGSGFAYTAFISSTTPDGLATFLPHNDRPVQPGQTDAFTVSLRFAPSGSPTASLATDAYQNWSRTWPMQLNWPDRRVIGYAALASSPQTGSVNQQGGFPNNPRRYFNDSNANDFDITTPTGLAKFQARVLAQAQADVMNLQQLNAQGVITWDIEGEQYPQDTSYVCSPDQIAVVAPEMESVITDPMSPFKGMKLDDAYFKTITNAGFRVGVCVRPQHFTLNRDGTAQQTYLPVSSVEAELEGKMKYAHDRWGATLFYVDSSVESDGAVLDAGIFQRLAAALPDSLIMPEESTPKHYAYTAPFQSFIFHGDKGTDPSVYNYYPKAFSAILVNDVDASKLAAARPDLTASVRNGDVLMTHADYWQANNPTIVQIYQDAGGGTPTPPPTPPPSPASGPLSIQSPADGSTVSGAIVVAASVGVQLDAAGSYLTVDGAEWGTARVTQSPFSFPLDTTLLTNGTHALALWAHDAANNTYLSPPVTITVANTAGGGGGNSGGSGTGGNNGGTNGGGSGNPTPPPTTGLVTITSPSSGATLSGAVAVVAQVNVNLDAAGSYLMVDGNEIGVSRVSQSPYSFPLDTTTLSNGPHTLQIWAHDTSNTVDLSPTVAVTITNSGSSSGGGPATGGGSGSGTTPTTYPIALTYPLDGQGISGVVVVTAAIKQQLDAAASFLMLDGIETGPRVGAAPYVYPLDTTKLVPGTHILQVWAHDTNNDTLLSNPVTVTVAPH